MKSLESDNISNIHLINGEILIFRVVRHVIVVGKAYYPRWKTIFEERNNMKLCQRLKKSFTKTLELLYHVYGNLQLLTRFFDGWESSENDPRNGRQRCRS